MSDEGVYNPSGEPIASSASEGWARSGSPFSRGSGPPGFHIPKELRGQTLIDPLRMPRGDEVVASIKLKSISPPPSGSNASQRAMEWLSMSAEERKAKEKDHQVSAGHEIDPDLWGFLYITRNQLKALRELAALLVNDEWMSDAEAEKWCELQESTIVRDFTTGKGLLAGGAVLCYGPLRRSRLLFEVNEEKSTQFYRKVKVYASLYFQPPEDRDVPPDEPTEAMGEPDPEWSGFISEFGSMLEDEAEPATVDFTEVTELDDDAERGKWSRSKVESDPREWADQVRALRQEEKRKRKEDAASRRAVVHEQKRKARSQKDKAKAQEQAGWDALPKIDPVQEKSDWAKAMQLAQVWKENGRDKSSEPSVPSLMDRLRAAVNKTADQEAFKSWALEQRTVWRPKDVVKWKLEQGAQRRRSKKQSQGEAKAPPPSKPEAATQSESPSAPGSDGAGQG